MRTTLGILREYLQATREQDELLIVEGRVEDAREKYPDLEDEDFDFLVANQPAGSNNKYLLWACARVSELFENDPDKIALTVVTQAIRLFDGNKQRLEKKDLYQYKTAAEVEEAVEKLGGPSKAQKAAKARADTDVIYNDDRWLVLRPHTTESSCKYGIGTKWCIAATASRNYYNQYSTSNNKFYFVIDKQAPERSSKSKHAIVILDPVTAESENRIQVFNSDDHQVGLRSVIQHVGDKWPQIWSKIKEHVAANPITREVEDARKATEEHVKALMKGERVGNEGLKKIASDANLTTPIVRALIKFMKERTGPRDYTDPSGDIIASLARRASSIPPEAALELIKFVPTTKPEGDRYWSGSYHLTDLIRNAPLTPEAFRELSHSADETTLNTVLQNPNIPDDIVQNMAGKISEISNKELKRNIFKALIRSGNITAEQMQQALNADLGYYSIAHDIIHYPELSSKLSPELLRMVPVRDGSELKKFLALPNVPQDLVADLISRYWEQLKGPELYQLLRSINLPTEMIERIWANKNQHIRVSLLQNPNIGIENAKKFAASRNSAYRFAVAHNTVLPPEDLQILAGDESASTRAAVGANPNTPPETLRVLAGDEATVVRASVASNPKAPVPVLQALKRDSDEFVRKAVRKTLKSLETAETYIRMSMSMMSLLTEEMEDDSEMQDIMTPNWSEIPQRTVEIQEWLAVMMLQNNGSATREEVEEAFGRWAGRPTYYGHGRARRHTRGSDIWSIIRQKEKYLRDDDPTVRTITSQGKGWFWSPPGINKGSIYRLTPAGAAAAMRVLEKVKAQYPDREWSTRPAAPVRRSPPPAGLNPQAAPAQAAAAAGAPRGPKTTYKIYGRFKGHPVATRLKGQAYVGAAGTQFSAGEQAEISPTDNGKLRVKKAGGDHTQVWEPIDG